MATKIKNVVGQFLDEINGGRSEYARAYRIALLGKKELDWDLTGTVKPFSLSVNGDLTSSLPDDCIKVLSVGVSGHGGTALLTRNDSLSFDTGICTEEDIDQSTLPEYENGFFGYGDTIFGERYQRSYGLGSYNSIGQYRVQGNRIILNPEFGYANITGTYLASSDVDGDICIHDMASNALLAWIRWRWHIAKKGSSAFDKQYYEKEYFREKGNAKMRIKSPSKSDMNRLSRESTKMSIRS